jgi:mediator of RNA polymerase II transcription subunit 14
MISRIVDVRVLEERGIKHLEKREDNDSLPAPIKLPVVYVRLSDIAPSLAPKKNPSASWAVDFVKISFRGAQQSADDDRNAQPGVAGHRLIKALSDATITVADKTKFKDLGGNVDSDVTFDTRVGEFTLHLRQEIGTSLVDCLATRLQAIGRLVDFVDAMRKSGGAIVCKSATMREIVFSYGDNLLEQSGDASQQQPMWTARLDLVSGPNIKLCLEKGTPHLRVLDLLESEANSPQLRELPYYLKLTFSMLKALESIEDAWTKIKENDDGRVDIRHWSLEKATIQYRLGRYASQQRRLKLSLKKAWRAGTDYWHLCPEDRDGNVIPLDSDFHKALKPIFEGRGDHWRGLRTGAVGEVGRGIEELLSLVDNAIVTLVGSPPPDAGGRPGNKPASPIVLD